MRGRSASKPARANEGPAPNLGLVNSTDCGLNAASCVALFEPGQVFWYETPSKSLSVPRQPLILTRRLWSGVKHGASSASVGWPLFSLAQPPFASTLSQY